MTQSLRPPLDAEALALFARKGLGSDRPVPQGGEINGVKVRRVLQLTCDLARRPLESLRILDLGCGEGVYAIEAGLRGATVVAIDARTQRMELGAACAARHGLDNVRFEQGDVRRVTRATHGEFDVVYGLGILYHLDVPDVFTLLENVRAMCTGLLVVDTFISVSPSLTVSHRDVPYEGERCREHADDDPEDVRRSRVLRSIDNTFSFRFSRPALARALHGAGFSSVLECHVPQEPRKPVDRITLAALAGARTSIATYPWVNGLSEREVEARIEALETEAR
jgi:SAM-dependent methyltransferase